MLDVFPVFWIFRLNFQKILFKTLKYNKLKLRSILGISCQ